MKRCVDRIPGGEREPAPKGCIAGVSMDEVERLFAKQQRELTKVFERSIDDLWELLRDLLSKEKRLTKEPAGRASEQSRHRRPREEDGAGYMRFPELHSITGLARSTVWRGEKTGTFPARRKISSRGVGWLRSEIDTWVRERRQVGGANSGGNNGR